MYTKRYIFVYICEYEFVSYMFTLSFFIRVGVEASGRWCLRRRGGS